MTYYVFGETLNLALSIYLSIIRTENAQIVYTEHTVNWRIFSSLHAVQTRYSDDNFVCPSVCLSNAWIVIKTEKKICPDFYTIQN